MCSGMEIKMEEKAMGTNLRIDKLDEGVHHHHHLSRQDLCEYGRGSDRPHRGHTVVVWGAGCDDGELEQFKTLVNKTVKLEKRS